MTYRWIEILVCVEIEGREEAVQGFEVNDIAFHGAQNLSVISADV